MSQPSSAGFVDLHMHTTHSDGSLTPGELAERVRESGVTAVALTDHDSLAGVAELRRELHAAGIEVSAGVELSATDGNADIHVLAYNVDESNDLFTRELERFVLGRTERAKVMLEKLRAVGVDIPFSAVEEIANGAAVGRPHVAEALMTFGHVKDLDEAFQRWIGARGPCYVPKTTLLAAEAIAMVHGVGGVAVLAHPQTLGHDEMIPGMIAAGLDGLEVMHPRQDGSARMKYFTMAKKHALLVTGGSDFHGKRTPNYSIGMCKVPASVYDAVRAVAAGQPRTTVPLSI